MVIKNKIIDLQNMFESCQNLKNIDEVKYLNTKYCPKWNVSNGTNFSCMFCNCSSLKDIKLLEKWNVSNGVNFTSILYGCSSVKDIKPLEKWNVSNSTIFLAMFNGCSLLKEIKPLENWNIKENNFNDMFKNV